LTDLIKSVVRDIGADKGRAFSSFDDFVEFLIAQNKINSREQLIQEKPDLLGSILFQWYVQGQVACVFAQMLAKQATKWQSVTIPGEVDVNEIQGFLEENADNLEAVQFLFIGPATVDHAVQLIRALCEHPSWSCHEKGWMEGELGESLMVGLRWQRPGTDYVSWVLGIAPFEPMPFTRRFVGAPFIALVFRPSPPTAFAKTPKDLGFDASHLAHMDDMLGADQQRRDRTTLVTQYHKQTLLGEELRSHARAKVTFALPAAARDSLADILQPPQ
jgi:hypothetical protein